MQNKRILIAAGGTGGHIIPAVTLSRKMLQYDYAFICGSRNIESKVYAGFGIKPYILPMGSFSVLRFAAGFAGSFAGTVQAFLEFRPDAVIVSGSYITALPGILGVVLNKPVFILEQDTVLGRTNRMLGYFAKRIFSGFDIKCRHKRKVVHTGHVLRDELFTKECSAKVNIPEGSKVILVLGGSQGALNMTRTVIEHLSAKNGLFIIAVAGDNADKFSQKENVRILPYSNDMGCLYSGSDLIISRAGALSYAEILRTGKPALFIPLPSSRDNHQLRNARYYCSMHRHFRIIEESELNPGRLSETVSDLLGMQADDAVRTDSAEIIEKEMGHYV